NGNKYYEDHTEVPGRHRWVDFAQHDVHVSQIEPVWHAWLHHTKTAPPTNDEVVLNARQTWEAPPSESTTGTRAAFRTYNTTRPKIVSVHFLAF
ncbi:hypothetical protein FA09DRAFT_329576, partial [Tilletiopsis washingtonensis]